MTNEERATIARKIYTSEDTLQLDEFADGVQVGQAVGFKDGYIKGATEQKAIDIEKACKWLDDQLYTDDAGSLTSDWYQDLDEFTAAFCKAMEE